MIEVDIIETLEVFGLTSREAETYVFLAKRGPQPVSFLARSLKLDRVYTYRLIKGLQKKGFVETVLENPTHYAVVPFEKLIESFIQIKKSEIKIFEQQKNALLSFWKSLDIHEPNYSLAKFSIISGRNQLYSRITQMINETQKEICMLISTASIIQGDSAGLFDIIASRALDKIQFKILTNISLENLHRLKEVMKPIIPNIFGIEVRHDDITFDFIPLFVIKDNDEVLLYMVPPTASSIWTSTDEGLWINTKMFVSIIKTFFKDKWNNAIDAAVKIEALETGGLIKETTVIKDPHEAQQKLTKILDTASEEVIAIVSSDSVNAITKTNIFRKCFERDVTCRIMAPLDLDNLDAAQQLGDLCQLKHVEISYLTILMIDGTHLFAFKSLPIDDFSSDSVFYFADMFYSNDDKFTKIVETMLNSIWKRGRDLSELRSVQGMKMPAVTVSGTDTMTTVANEMLRNNVSTVLVAKNNKPTGIISERDVLKIIVETRKNPDEIDANNITKIPFMSVEKDDQLPNALKTIREKEIERVAIIRNGKLIGMLR